MTLLRRAVLATMVAALAATLLAPAANASVSQGYVSGGGPRLTDDFNDEGILSQSSFPNSNATGLWQIILYADNFLELNDIDCRFGRQTASATRAWQDFHNIGIDGIVGRETFSTAGRHLTFHEISGIIVYQGHDHRVLFTRSNGRYRILDRYIAPSDPDGSHIAYYRRRASDC